MMLDDGVDKEKWAESFEIFLKYNIRPKETPTPKGRRKKLNLRPGKGAKIKHLAQQNFSDSEPSMDEDTDECEGLQNSAPEDGPKEKLKPKALRKKNELPPRKQINIKTKRVTQENLSGSDSPVDDDAEEEIQSSNPDEELGENRKPKARGKRLKLLPGKGIATKRVTKATLNHQA